MRIQTLLAVVALTAVARPTSAKESEADQEKIERCVQIGVQVCKQKCAAMGKSPEFCAEGCENNPGLDAQNREACRAGLARKKARDGK
jgi:hypothetical protein